jgi:hypothetical protein
MMPYMHSNHVDRITGKKIIYQDDPKPTNAINELNLLDISKSELFFVYYTTNYHLDPFAREKEF